MCSRLFNCPRAIRAIICLFLACLLVFCFIAPPYLQAYAIVDIILSGAISSTMSALFTLSGIKFASSSDLISGIELAWANFDKATQQLISDVVGVGNPIGGAFIEPTTIPLPVALISGFVTAIQNVFPITQTSVPSLPSTGGAVYSPESYLIQSLFDCDIELLRPIFKQYKYLYIVFDISSKKISNVYLFNVFPTLSSDNIFSTSCILEFPSSSSFSSLIIDNGAFSISSSLKPYFWLYSLSYSSKTSMFFCSFNYKWGSSDTSYVSSFNVNSLLKYAQTGIVSSPDVINPSDLAYTADKSICVDGVLTKAMDDVLAKNPTKETVSIVVPANAADFVDAGLKDVVTDKDLSDAIDRAIANAGSGTVTGDITLPNVGELSLPAKIITVFPFSIPWDISRGLAVFKSEPITPRFEIPFIVAGVIDTQLVLDFTKFDFIIRLIRWGELTVFIVGLAIATRKLIRW